MKTKKSKTNVWQGALSWAVALTLVLSSCSKESLELPMPGGNEMEVQVTFPQSLDTRGGTDVGSANENRLDNVTILVFNQDGTTLETALSVDVTVNNTTLDDRHPKWKFNKTLMIASVSSMSSPKKIYAIANWSTKSFDASYTEAKLKAELTTINAVANMNENAYPMLMSGSTSVANLTTTPVTVAMERQAAKIKALLTMPIAVQDRMTNIKWQTDLMKITVANVPNKSYVIGGRTSPAGIAFLNSAAIAVNDIRPAAGDQTVPATKELKWSESIYITENPVTGIPPAKSTYIVVQLPYKNGPTGSIIYENYYKLLVNDTRDATSPHKVLRNTIYNFNISIVGMGLPYNDLAPDVNIEDQLMVNSWENEVLVDMDKTPINYFNINRSSIGFKSTETSYTCTITTDVKNWKLIKEDGTTMFSFADNKTTPITVAGITYTLSGTVSVATLTVSKAANLSFTKQKMFFIAKNLKVPFTVA